MSLASAECSERKGGKGRAPPGGGHFPNRHDDRVGPPQAPTGPHATAGPQQYTATIHPKRRRSALWVAMKRDRGAGG